MLALIGLAIAGIGFVRFARTESIGSLGLVLLGLGLMLVGAA